jgi:hypothetical protein
MPEMQLKKGHKQAKELCSWLYTSELGGSTREIQSFEEEERQLPL